MPRPFSIIGFFILIVLTGCMGSHGFDRATIKKALHSTPRTDQSSHPTTPTLSMPFHLGVFFIHRNAPRETAIQPVDWLSRDGETLLRWLTPLQDDHILADTFVLSDPTIHGENIEDIKRVGVRYGADVVLIVDGLSTIDHYDNGYASLYPTIVGAYLAPGTVSQALVTMSGSLWDVHSDWHAPAEFVEGQSKAVAPVLQPQDTAAVRDAKDAALDAFGKRVAEQLWILVEEIARAKPDSPRIETEEHAQ